MSGSVMSRHARFYLFAVMIMGSSSLSSAATLTVAPDGTGDFTEIQPAIDAAVEGDTVLVTPGEYVIAESIDFNRLHDPADPDAPPLKNIVVQSEAGPSETTIRVSDTPADPRRTDVVVFENAETDASRLEGFTLTEGYYGVFCTGSSAPTLTNCMISHNGNGLSCRQVSAPRVKHCTISRNSRRGVLCSQESSPTLESCTISENNTSYGRSERVPCRAPTQLPPRLETDGGGGGVWCWDQSSPRLMNCTVTGNLDGGLYCSRTMTLTSCVVWDNSGGSLLGFSPTVSYSCIQSLEVWPGVGNINQDPLFCGWPSREVFVDAALADGGDGTWENPFADLSSALEGFSISIHRDSPCIGTGENGVTMGAPTEICDAAPEGQREIHLASGVYPLAQNLAHRVNLLGAGVGETVLEGTVRGLRSGAVLRGLTVTRGTKSGIVVGSGESPEIASCTISGNSGCGAYCSKSSSPTIRDCMISENSGCGVFSDYLSLPNLINCTITGNIEGGLYCSSSATITNCLVWDNAGGALLGDRPIVSYCCIESVEVWPGVGNINQDPLFCGWPSREVFVDAALADGGDGTWENPFADLSSALEGFSVALHRDSPCIGTGTDGMTIGAPTEVSDALPGREREIYLASGTYRLAESIAHRVSLLGAGAGETVIEGTVRGLRRGSVLRDLTVTGEGSGILLGPGDSPEIMNCSISGNSGCGLYCYQSSPTVRGCTFTRNTGCGVSCYCSSSPTLTDCTISENTSTGVHCQRNSSPTLRNCTISRNIGCESGNGVYCLESSPTMENCTISGNIGEESGGGVHCDYRASPKLTNCTISQNYICEVYCGYQSSPKLTNCIVFGDWGSPFFLYDECWPRVTYSCVRGQEVWPGTGNINADPRLTVPGGWEDCQEPTAKGCVPLDCDNAFWARWVPYDQRLRPGSPCIDTGTSEGAPETDIEGNERPCGEGIDMGAYEFGDCFPRTSFLRGDCNTDGEIDISDAICILGWLFLGDAVPGCVAATNANGDIDADLSDAVYLLSSLFLGGPPPAEPFPDCGPMPEEESLPCEVPPESCQ